MNDYLETAIAVVLIILAFSIITYIFQELIAANLMLRGKMLQNSIRQLLGTKAGSDLTKELYDHPQIKLLKENLSRLPSYISSQNFAIAIMDLVAGKAPAAANELFADFKAGIAPYAVGNTDLQTWLESLAKVSSDGKELEANIEKWYNDYMDRVTGWYKKQSTIITRIIAVVVVLAFNVDLVKIITVVHKDEDLKARLNATATVIADNQQLYTPLFEQTVQTRIKHLEDSLAKDAGDSAGKAVEADKLMAAKDTLVANYTKDRIKEVDALLNTVNDDKLSIGLGKISDVDLKDGKWAWPLLGWLLAVAAISMGAPFWFDLLVKLVNVRKAGIKPGAKK